MQDDYSRATAYVSSQAHHCIEKALTLAGIPRKNLRKIRTDDQFRIRISDLNKAIRDDLQNGLQPFLLIGNAGTTNTGAIDDLQSLAEIANEHELWFHTDAAYGGFFLLTDRGRKRLTGIELSDSVVLDPHKGLFLPYGTGCLLVREYTDLHDAFSLTSEYMPSLTGDPDRVDFCEMSPELSRENRSLRIWLPFKLHGKAAFSEALDEKLDLAEWAAEQLSRLSTDLSGKLQIVATPQLSILAFRLFSPRLSDEELNEINQQFLTEINRDRRVMLTGTSIDGMFVIRICVLSFRTHVERVRECIERIEKSARMFVSQHLQPAHQTQ